MPLAFLGASPTRLISFSTAGAPRAAMAAGVDARAKRAGVMVLTTLSRDWAERTTAIRRV